MAEVWDVALHPADLYTADRKITGRRELEHHEFRSVATVGGFLECVTRDGVVCLYPGWRVVSARSRGTPR